MTHNSFLSSHAKIPYNQTHQYKQEIELMGGMKFNITLPPGTVRITAFNVEPRSVPHGKAC